MSYRGIFAPEAEEQLAAPYRYIAEAASPDIAAQYTEAIVSCCENLSTFPYRGIERDDVRPGLRITNYKKRAVIAFHVEAGVVSIIGTPTGAENTNKRPNARRMRREDGWFASWSSHVSGQPPQSALLAWIGGASRALRPSRTMELSASAGR